MNQPFFSIAIPTYEMNGYGKEFLNHSLEMLNNQTFKNFEIIVSDHSKNDIIENLCNEWSENLNLKYYKNNHKIGSSSSNINNALVKSKGKWIKILFQDDFLFSVDSLKILKEHIEVNEKKEWFATSCEHSKNGFDMYSIHHPIWTDDIHLGNNRISSPSVITIKNVKNKQLFNEELLWLMDVDFYKSMYIKHGEPSYLKSVIIVNRVWGNSVSNTLTEERKEKELILMKEKFK